MQNLINNQNNTKRKSLLKNSDLKTSLTIAILLITVLASATSFFWFINRYTARDEMEVSIKEFSNREYPANTSSLSVNHQRYTERKLRLVRKNDTHYDFILEPTNSRTAKIVLKNVDISLFIPKIPESILAEQRLIDIYLTEREFSRQQVSFPIDSEFVEIIGGDGFEKENLHSIALANNCLNAGYWEIILSTKENGQKSAYYQGWFTFPMGHYKNIFEKINPISYWQNWWRLEHWQDPDGTKMNLNLLRNIVNERQIKTDFPKDERILVSGEQTRKIRTLLGDNLVTWGDFYKQENQIEFATFRVPGWYDTNTPWQSQYWRIGQFDNAILRTIKPNQSQENLQEIELRFRDTKTGEQNKILLSGINLKELPKLAVSDYNKGLYLPLGIQVPPFYQSYKNLQSQSASENHYFGVMLDSKNRWINHHELAIDGFVMHLDKDNPNRLHTYLLSYERHTLIAHFISDLGVINATPSQKL